MQMQSTAVPQMQPQAVVPEQPASEEQMSRLGGPDVASPATRLRSYKETEKAAKRVKLTAKQKVDAGAVPERVHPAKRPLFITLEQAAEQIAAVAVPGEPPVAPSVLRIVAQTAEPGPEVYTRQGPITRDEMLSALLRAEPFLFVRHAGKVRAYFSRDASVRPPLALCALPLDDVLPLETQGEPYQLGPSLPVWDPRITPLMIKEGKVVFSDAEKQLRARTNRSRLNLYQNIRSRPADHERLAAITNHYTRYKDAYQRKYAAQIQAEANLPLSAGGLDRVFGAEVAEEELQAWLENRARLVAQAKARRVASPVSTPLTIRGVASRAAVSAVPAATKGRGKRQAVLDEPEEEELGPEPSGPSPHDAGAGPSDTAVTAAAVLPGSIPPSLGALGEVVTAPSPTAVPSVPRAWVPVVASRPIPFALEPIEPEAEEVHAAVLPVVEEAAAEEVPAADVPVVEAAAEEEMAAADLPVTEGAAAGQLPAAELPAVEAAAAVGVAAPRSPERQHSYRLAGVEIHVRQLIDDAMHFGLGLRQLLRHGTEQGTPYIFMNEGLLDAYQDSGGLLDGEVEEDDQPE